MKPLLERIALQAGHFLKDCFLKKDFEQINLDADHITTTADKESERIIVSALADAFPSHGILSEERQEKLGQNEYRWIIDPLDGTVNFSQGIPFFAISIALQKGDEIECGLIYAPLFDQFYWAEKGKGACLGNKKLTLPASRGNLEPLISLYNTEKSNSFSQWVVSLHPRVHLRRFSCASLELAWIASHCLNGFIHTQLNLWDIAAGILLIEEAGGFVCDLQGRQKRLERGGILAGDPSIKEKLVTAQLDFHLSV